jgi:hypothetical protein
MKNEERYIGYANLLNLPSKRIGLEVTLNQLEELIIEMKNTNKVKILILPLKPHNVTTYKSHSVKISNNKYKLVKEH